MTEFILQNIVLAHHFSAPPGWICNEYAAARLHHGLVYILDGQAEYRFADGGSLMLSPGDCLYLPRGTMYVACSAGTNDFVHMTVNFSLAEDGFLFSTPTKCHFYAPTRFEQVFSSLVRHWTVRHPYYRERSHGLLYELIYLLLREVNSAPRRILEKVQPARAYLDAHFCENFSLRILPELCGLSETYFRRLFCSIFHETPSEYRTRLRMARASDLLLSGVCGIEQIGALCGYEDPAYFSRMFHKTMGQSPTQFLKSHKDEGQQDSGAY